MPDVGKHYPVRADRASRFFFYVLLTVPELYTDRLRHLMSMLISSVAFWKRTGIGLVLASFVALTLTAGKSSGARIPYSTAKPLLAGSNTPEPVISILERACQDCHSGNTVWPWYASIPPVSWQVHQDVSRARAFMDLSKWNSYTEAERKVFLLSIVAATQSHVMPPPRYLWMHRNARLSDTDVESLKSWALTNRTPKGSESIGQLPLTNRELPRSDFYQSLTESRQNP